MSDRARLFAGIAVMAAAAGVAMAGARATWVVERWNNVTTVIRETQETVQVGSRVNRYSGVRLHGGLTPLSFAVLVAAIAALLSGPRLRRVLLSAAAVIGVALAWNGITVDGRRRSGALLSPDLYTQTATHWVVVAAGILIVAAAIFTFGPAGRVPRLAMPDAPADPDVADGIWE